MEVCAGMVVNMDYRFGRVVRFLKAMSVTKPYGAGEWELYNVAEDPGETRDLARQKPELLQELKAAWSRYAKGVGVVLTKN